MYSRERKKKKRKNKKQKGREGLRQQGSITPSLSRDQHGQKELQ